MTDTEPTVPANPNAGRTPRRHRGWIAVLVLAVGYVLDQLTKRWVETTMTEGQVIDALPPLLRWHFIRNPGAAFSIGEEHTWVFTIIQASVAVFVVVLLFRVRSTAWALALGGLLGEIGSDERRDRDRQRTGSYQGTHVGRVHTGALAAVPGSDDAAHGDAGTASH